VELAKAEEMLKKALAAARRGEQMAFADSLAWVYYKQDRLRQAGRMFQAMLADRLAREEDQDEHAVILDHAADAYYRLGWKDRAVEFWKRAMEMATKAERADREEKALLVAVPAKIEALAKGREPKVAPLGTPAPQAPKDAADEASPPE
jgi:tetratricopeptide (TPR) repeat protein